MKFLKRLSWFEIVLAAVVLAIHLYAALSDAYNLPNAWFIRDDAYYYFKVAQNITEGKGSTFDGINPTNGYHPLWMAVCIPIFYLARFDLILPLRVLLMVMAALNAAASILIYRLVRENLSEAVALIAAPFWAFNQYIHHVVYKFGLETPLAAFTVVLFVYLLSRFEKRWRANPVTFRQLAGLALMGAVVMFSRLDLVFFAVTAGIWIIFRGHPIRILLPLDMAVIFFSMTSSVALRTGIKTYNSLYSTSTLEAVLLMLVLKVGFLYFLGSYQHPRSKPVGKTVLQTLLALAAGSTLALVMQAALGQFGVGRDLPRSAFLIDWVVSSSLILALRMGLLMSGTMHTIQSSAPPHKDILSHWKKWLTEGSIYYGLLGGTLALYLAYNKIIFETASPVSGQIKRWWGSLGNTVYDYPAASWPAFLGLSSQGVYSAWQPLADFLIWIAARIKPLYPGSNTLDERYAIVLGVFAAAAVGFLLSNAGRMKTGIANLAVIPLAAGCAIQILSYTTTSYGGAKEWYWVGQMILIVLAAAVFLDTLIKPIETRRGLRKTLQFTSIAAGISLAVRLGGNIGLLMRYDYFPPDRPYMEVLPFLEANTPPGSMIGMTGGGNVGYFIHDRVIVNMDGLINSYDYFKAVQSGSAPQYLKEHGMQIVFANPRLLTLPPYYGQFAPYLSSFGSFGGKDLLYLLDEPKY